MDVFPQLALLTSFVIPRHTISVFMSKNKKEGGFSFLNGTNPSVGYRNGLKGRMQIFLGKSVNTRLMYMVRYIFARHCSHRDAYFHSQDREADAAILVEDFLSKLSNRRGSCDSNCAARARIRSGVR